MTSCNGRPEFASRLATEWRTSCRVIASIPCRATIAAKAFETGSGSSGSLL